MNKAIFLDRDGVIIEDTNYPHLKKDLKFLKNAPLALKKLMNAGYLLIIISNQSGVSRGFFDLKQMFVFEDFIEKKLRENGVKIKEFLFCPHRPEDNCSCRKPKNLLLEKAIKKYSISREKSYFIGDRESDVLCGLNSNIPTIQIVKDNKTSIASSADYVTSSLEEAAKIVLNNSSNKIYELKDLLPIIKKLKSAKKNIVTINGSFDLMHSGHIKSLENAKAYGDFLIVGVNSDKSVKKYKSSDRPILPQDVRARLVASIAATDFVFIFDEINPINFLKKIIPAIHINSAEYGENCVEAPILKKIGSKLVLLNRTAGISTSEIIAKISKNVSSLAS